MRTYRLALMAAVALAVPALALLGGATSAAPSAKAAAPSSKAAAGATGLVRTTLNGKPCVRIPQNKIGIQLWAVQTLLSPTLPPSAPPGTPAPPPDPVKLDSGLAQVAAMGYRYVEPYSTYNMTAPQFKALLDKHGLTAIGSHTTVSAENWDATLDYAAGLGEKYIGSSLPPTPGVTSMADLMQTAKNVNDLGKRAAARGIKLYLHNHTIEFENRYLYDINKDGKPVMTPAWQIMVAETDPRYVNFEVDVNWYYRGLQGLGEAQELTNFLKKYSPRIVLLHIKEPNAEPSPSRGEVDVGSGNVIDWPAVYAAAKNVKYYIYEVDPSLLPQPPDLLRSAQTAYKYMTCQA